MSTARLDHVFHYRWAVPILSELQRSDGAKFVTLLNRLGISRDSLQRTLEALIEAGWIMRNPGHGHPLRPEYILSGEGTPLAAASSKLLEEIKAQALEELALKKWSMPILFALRDAPLRFSGLRAELPEITPRALTLAIKELLDAALVEREVAHGFPPTTSYRAGAKAVKLLERLHQVDAHARIPSSPHRTRAQRRRRR